MSLPQINPLAAKLIGGRSGREKLRDQLLARADETDDPAYAKRLRDTADGKRPLRTVLSDPAFQASMGMDDPRAERAADALFADHEAPAGTHEELRERARADLTEQGIEIPTADEARAVLPDVLGLQQQAAEVIAQEDASGWGGSVERIAAEREAAEAAGPEDGHSDQLGDAPAHEHGDGFADGHGLGHGLGDGLGDPGDDITGPGGIT